MTSGPPAPYAVATYASATAATTFTVPLNVASVNGGDCIVVGITPAYATSGWPNLVSVTDDAGNSYSFFGTAGTANGPNWALANPSATGGLLEQQNLYITMSASCQITVVAAGVPNVNAFEGDAFNSVGGSTVIATMNGVTVPRTVQVTMWANSLFQATGTVSNCTIVPNSECQSAGSGYAGMAYGVATATGSGPTASLALGGTSPNMSSGAMQFSIGPAYIANQALNSGVVGIAYSQTINVVGNGTMSASLQSGTMPPGLTLATSAGVTTITGTPTTTGTYTIVLEAADTVGSNTTTFYTFVINILPKSLTGVPAMKGSGYESTLTPVDADFETGAGSWVPFLNAGTPAQVTGYAATGSSSLTWNATADGDSAIATAAYPAEPGPYIASALMTPRAYIGPVAVGMAFYNNSTLLSVQYGPQQSQPFTSNGWLPCTGQFTAPAGTNRAKMIAYAYGCYAGDLLALDTCSFSQSDTQILVDWVNTSFTEDATGGQMFMDISPWVSVDVGVSLTRGKQNHIDEVQASTAAWTLLCDTGYFTKFSSNALAAAVGGQCDIGRRYQINFADENGAWYTRADGPISGFDYVYSTDGNTCSAAISGTDVLAPLSRQDVQTCWTREQIFFDATEYGLDYHWSLDDAGNAGGAGVATESSGNLGPAMRLKNTDSTAVATIAWQSTNGGIETLADSVAAGQPDGSEYWAAESPQLPGSLVRGLDANALGPYTSPLGSVYFTPVLTAATGANYFSSNTGYYLQTQLPGPITDDVEFWFTQDPIIATSKGSKLGPFIPLSIAESKTGRTVTVGLNMNTSDVLFEVSSWNKPPGYAALNFGTAPPSAAHTYSQQIHADTQQVPHHCVLQFWNTTGDGAIIRVWLDGALVGNIPWPNFFAYDTITVGGCYGGGGAHAGGVQLVSLWQNNLSESTIKLHCAMGQYGMYEHATDTCISKLAQFCNIPAYWNNIPRNVANALTLADYQDLSGSNGLANMQLFEQAEQGELFVNAAGQLCFATRDQRMGYHAPDLLLPPDSFDAGMGYQLNDQFLVNEAAVTTQIFANQTSDNGGLLAFLNGQTASPTSGAFINAGSQQQYGTYAPNPVSSPLTLPLFTFSRAGTQLGVPSFDYSTTPYLEDWAAWQANSQSVPWMMPGQLTVDLLTLDPTWGLAISDFYELEIGNMVAPSGTLPKSFPSQAASMEWFIEGINETRSLTSHTLQFYCSPAEQQRAWIPGDPVYGKLDSTAFIGVSQYDTHATAALYKDVSHDAGGPYWPPAFSQWMNSPRLQDLANSPYGINMAPLQGCPVLNVNGDFSAGNTSNWGTFDGTLTYISQPPVGIPGTTPCPTQQCGEFVNTSGTTGNTDNTAVPVTPGRYYYVTAQVFIPGTSPVSSMNLGLITQTSGGGHVGDAYNTITGIPLAQWVPIGSMVYIPEGASIAQAQGYTQLPTTVSTPYYLTSLTVQEVTAGFVGANDLRGLIQPLTNMVQPPKMVARQILNSQAVSSGGPVAPTVIAWDTVDADSEGGLGLCPGYPSWYVCTVPGFYDIDHSVVWNATSATGHILQSWAVVARGAMQTVAAGTGTPRTAAAYVSPAGSSAPTNASAGNTCVPVTSGSARLYLGFGDMVAIAANCDIAQSTIGTSASSISIVYRGQATQQDGVQFNEFMQGGTVTNNPNTSAYTATFTSTKTQLYFGNPPPFSEVNGVPVYVGPNKSGQRQSSNTRVSQGYVKSDKTAGSQYSLISFPYASIESTLSATGTVIESVWLEFSEPPVQSSGAVAGPPNYGFPGLNVPSVTLMLGWSQSNGGATFNIHGVSGRDFPDKHRVSWTSKWGETKHLRVRLPNEFATAFQSGSAETILIGDGNSTGSKYHVNLNGTAGSWTLVINYEVTP